MPELKLWSWIKSVISYLWFMKRSKMKVNKRKVIPFIDCYNCRYDGEKISKSKILWSKGYGRISSNLYIWTRADTFDHDTTETWSDEPANESTENESECADRWRSNGKHARYILYIIYNNRLISTPYSPEWSSDPKVLSSILYGQVDISIFGSCYASFRNWFQRWNGLPFTLNFFI